MENKPIYVVSDLHMGDGGPRDNFEVDNKEKQFDEFLDMVAQNDGQLYILGDLFDFWQGNLGDLITYRMHLLDRFAEMEAVYVVGNHDWDLAGLIGKGFLSHPFFNSMQGPFIQEIGGKKFKFMHGHEVEPHMNDQRPGWGRILAILGGIIEDRKGSPMLSAGGAVEKTLIGASKLFMGIWNFSVNHFEHPKYKSSHHDFEEELTPSQNPGKVPRMLKLYEIDRAKEGCDVIVAGHTHRAKKTDPWYYNCGCWVGIRNNFIQISPAGEVDLFDWKDGQAIKW